MRKSIKNLQITIAKASIMGQKLKNIYTDEQSVLNLVNEMKQYYGKKVLVSDSDIQEILT